MAAIAAAKIRSTKPSIPDQSANGSPIDLSFKGGLHFR